jgi:pSer/pThr/pTyr-binding forkhead associated (FHA) protein
MNSAARVLGVFRPLGGGDPVDLKQDELAIGRRPTSDIRMDFENVSGKHALLRLVKGVWHIRDLGSTNGTTVNGQRIAHETGIMPGDEVGVATHFFTIDYDPIAPTSLMDANQILEEEIGENRHHPSLMELAGLSDDESRSRWKRPKQAPEKIARPAAADASFEDDLPQRFAKPKHREEEAAPAASEDDFFDLIRGDIDPDLPAKPKR